MRVAPPGSSGGPDLFSRILSAKPPLDAVGQQGLTALHGAVLYGDVGTIEALLKLQPATVEPPLGAKVAVELKEAGTRYGLPPELPLAAKSTPVQVGHAVIAYLEKCEIEETRPQREARIERMRAVVERLGRAGTSAGVAPATPAAPDYKVAIDDALSRLAAAAGADSDAVATALAGVDIATLSGVFNCFKAAAAAVSPLWDHNRLPIDRAPRITPFLENDPFSGGPELQMDPEDEHEDVAPIDYSLYRGAAKKILQTGLVFGATLSGEIIVAMPDYSGEQRNPVYAIAEPKQAELLGATIQEFVANEIAKILAPGG